MAEKMEYKKDARMVVMLVGLKVWLTVVMMVWLMVVL
jgi:hypothetical protein